MRQGMIRLVLCGTVVATALLAPSASAATLVGDYQFQSTDASSGPGPVLTNTGGGGPTSFQNDNVMGTSRQVLAFPEGTGLSMSPSVGTGDVPYSVVTTFRFADVNDYNRILDATVGSADQGFYVSTGTADIFGVNEASSTTIPFTNNAYATVALTSRPSAESRFYVNGAFAVNLNESFPVSADTLRFFKDDGSEDSAGAVSCIRVYTGVLTDAEVAAIGTSPSCQAPAPAPSVVKKKCKKHKKKHRSAESAKKKKCKKKAKH